MRVKPNILLTSEVLTFLNRPFFDKKQSLRRSYWNCCCCYLRACLEFVLVLSDLRQMEAKSLHYSGLLTTLQLRLAEGCWRNGFQDRFVQSGILSFLENFYSRHGSIDTIKIWSKHLHVQLPSSASKCTQESVCWICFSSWLVKNLARNFWAYILSPECEIYKRKKKSLKVSVFTQLESALTSNYNKCEYN